MREYRITVYLKTETDLSQYEIKRDLECEISCCSALYDIEDIVIEESLTKEEAKPIVEKFRKSSIAMGIVKDGGT